MAVDVEAAQQLDLPRAMIETATAVSDWAVILPVALCLAGGAFLVMMSRYREAQAGLSILLLLAVILSNVQLLVTVLENGPVAMTMGKWLPPFGITFVADTMSAAFALAASIVTLLVLLYMQSDLSAAETRHGFFPLVLMLLAGVSGAFLTGDLFNLYVWFEVMLIAAFGLMIMGGRQIQLDAAVKYGFLNFLATTFFLVSLGLLYGLVGTLNMADLIEVSASAPQAPMIAIAAMMLLAFGIKAAAFPVNSWLAASYHAPHAGVSALFAGLLTKVGAYVLLRIFVSLMPGTREVLEPVLLAVAVLTLVAGPLSAISETNLRRALGFIVVGGIGSILAGLAVPSLRGVAGGSIYAFNSMIAMAAFYMVAGLVERATGATDTRRMGGLYAVDSLLSILFLVLVFAAAGLPPFLGFWPKLLLIEASLDGGSYWLFGAILLNSILTTIAGTRLWAHIFWRPGLEGLHSEIPNPGLRRLTNGERAWSLAPSAVLVLGIVLMGLWPNFIIASGREAALGLLDMTRYVGAVGLEVTP